MKENKGFTLIELLAVIVILAIIALIATPMILGVIETAKKGASESSALGYIDAVEKQIAINELDSTKEPLNDGVYEVTDLLDTKYGITVKGEVPKSGWIIIKDGTITNYSLIIENYIVTKDKNIEKGNETLSKPICIRATKLHTEECKQTDEKEYCSGAGYTITGSKRTNIITYGQLEKEANKLSSGDAFDCDVNGDGIYNGVTERFYYVSNYYDSDKNEFDNNIVVLIYYNNTVNGISDNTGAIAYDLSKENYQGPINAIQYLPDVSQWNLTLKTSSRIIVNETGVSKINNESNSIKNPFKYENQDNIEYSTRLLTTQEVEEACKIKVGSFSKGELDNCNYLFENTKYSSSEFATYGYWLETPRSSNNNTACALHGNHRYVGSNYTNIVNDNGVRPVIEIPINQVEK